MGIDSSIFADSEDDELEQKPLPSLIELDRQVRESGRLRKPVAGDYAGKPAVSDVESSKKVLQVEIDSFGQKPYEP